MSARTLARRFEAELGMSLRSWRRRLRLFKAVELLGGGVSVTRTAMALGYGSASAFVYAFRSEMGCSPQAYMRGRLPHLGPVRCHHATGRSAPDSAPSRPDDGGRT